MKRFLVDTHALLWWAASPERLTEDARLAMTSGHSLLYFSHASWWEIAIKVSLQKLCMPESTRMLVRRSGCQTLPIREEHIDALTTLPWHHRDPFDRMLVAQAKTEGMTLITGDKDFANYEITTLAA